MACLVHVGVIGAQRSVAGVDLGAYAAELARWQGVCLWRIEMARLNGLRLGKAGRIAWFSLVICEISRAEHICSFDISSCFLWTFSMNELLILLALPSLIGGFFYFMMEPRNSSTKRALVVSLYGPAVAALSFYTVMQMGGPRTEESRDIMFLICLVLPPILVVASLFLFRGPKWVHVFMLPTGFCYLLLLIGGGFVYLNQRIRM